MTMTTSDYTLSRWDLSPLFPGQKSPEMEAALREVQAAVAEFENRRSELSAAITVDRFLEIVHELESISHLLYRINGFAGLSFTADTQNQEIMSFQAQIEQLVAEIQNRVLFFELWWKGLDDADADRLAGQAGDYRYWLENMRHFKPHTLSEAEEKVVNIKNVTGVQALINLYDQITNRYTFKIVVDGEEQELTRDELMVYARGPRPELRAAAYQELYKVYGEAGPTLGQVYQSVVRDWKNEQISLRGFASPIAARNLVNDIPDAVVDTLLEVCRQNASVFQRFFTLKAKLLGMERLRRYDIYAPVSSADKQFSFPTGAEMVLDSFRQFDPHLSDLAQRVFDEQRLDSQTRKGKRGGAFCATVVPDMTPWVLVNYNGRAEAVATLAHELGHAIHSMLAADHSLFTFHPSLPLAETASTFGEMMLVDQLLAQENDPAVRRDMLFRQVDDAYATIMRQAYFAMFERQAHQMVADGASADELSQMYLENLKEQFGDAVEISDEFRWEWASIPHFYHTPFYVYAYAFGQLLVFALYQQYQTEGEAFKARYLKILSAGGSEAPVKILADAGLDVYQAEFWQGGFDLIRALIEQLEALPAD